MKIQRDVFCRAFCAAFVQFLVTTGFSATQGQNLEKSFSITPGGKLVIHADLGSIQVATDGGDQAQLTVQRRVVGGTKAQADELLADHEVSFAQEGHTITVLAKRKSQKPWSWRPSQPRLEVRYLARIPSTFEIDLRTSGGDVEVGALEGDASVRTSSGTIKLDKMARAVDATNSGGDIVMVGVGEKLTARTSSGSITVQKAGASAELSNSGGNIRVEEAARDVVATTSTGSINIGKVRGSLRAKNSGGDVIVKMVDGTAEVETTSGVIRLGSMLGKELVVRNSGGDIRIEKAGGEASLRTSSGSIDVISADGPLTAKNSGGHITVGTAASTVTAQTSSGAIKVKTVKGAAELSNSGGDLVIGEVGGDLAARTSSGSIQIGAAHGNVMAKNSGGSISVAQAEGAVEAETSSGAISVAFARPPQTDCRLVISGGGINVTLPQSVSLVVNALTSGGQVITEFPVTAGVQGNRNSGSWQGKINGGGPALVLRASSGNIHIKKSAPVGTSREAEDPE